MKNTNEIYDKLDQIALMKPKDKEEALGMLLDNQLFQRVLVAAYDPFITYGIKKFKKTESVDPANIDFGKDAWDVLERLSQRKLTGNMAIEEVERVYSSLDIKSATLFERILKKDLRAGFTAKTINKARPNTIYVFSCMLSHKYSEKRIESWPVHVEEKLDGVRVLAINDGFGYRFYSRTGKEFHNYDHIAKTLNTTSNIDMVFDGEIVNKSGSFNETVGDAHRKNKQAESAVFHVFDMIPKRFFDIGKYKIPQTKRKSLLQSEILTMTNNDSVVYVQPTEAHCNQDILDKYESVRDKGGEGVIVKPLTGIYESKRSYSWLKIKDCQSVDVLITGFEEGEGKYKNKLGALLVDFKGEQVSVGGGLTDAQRSDMWSNQDQYFNKLIEVEYHEVTQTEVCAIQDLLKFETINLLRTESELNTVLHP